MERRLERRMLVEDHFDFLAPDDIRIKGSRIGIESVLYEHIHRSRTPEQIAAQFDTLTLEQVYAAILYYLHNRQEIDAYVAAWLEHGQAMRATQANDPAFRDFQARMRQARTVREARHADAAVTASQG
jgi:uncharacterized protein (DUF433 family)